MAEGWGGPGAGAALDALAAGWPWVQFHVGAPGAAGTSNPATETTRKQATFAATGTDGIMENTGALTWTNIAGTQDATHFSMKSASSAGTFGASGAVTANAYVAGDTVSIDVGALVVSVPLAS